MVLEAGDNNRVDVLVSPTDIQKVQKLMQPLEIEYTVLMEDYQKLIDTESLPKDLTKRQAVNGKEK